MTWPSTVFSRTRSLVFLCASLLGLSSTSLLCLALEASPPPFHDPRRLACREFLRSHDRSRSLLRSDLSCSCASGTTLGSDASSVVIDLGFCGVSTTALRFTSVVRFAHTRLHRPFGQGARLGGPSFPATRRISICLPILMLDFQILFLPLEDVQELFLQTPPIFLDTVLPWHDRMETVSHYLGNEEMSHAACRTIHLISALSADGLYFVCSCIAASIVRTCPLQLFLIVFDSSIAL